MGRLHRCGREIAFYTGEPQVLLLIREEEPHQEKAKKGGGGGQ